MRRAVLVLLGLGVSSAMMEPAMAAVPAETTQEVQALYHEARYVAALQKLSGIPIHSAEDREGSGWIEYWTGLCQSRLQNFSAAARHLQTAAQLGHRPLELEYERGQALFAAQELRPARDAFRQSALRGYRPMTSAYYQGYISQVLEERQAALAAFAQILKHPEDREKVRQAALFQVAELHAEQTEGLPEGRAQDAAFLRQVIPAYRKAMEIDPANSLAQEAREKIRHLQSRVSVPRMVNGVPIPERPWALKVSQELQYDSNVVTLADRSVTSVSDEGSLVSRTSAFGLYEFVLNQRWALSPEFSALYLRHTNRDNAQVYQNDGLNAEAALRTRYEHFLSDMPAALVADAGLTYLLRDYNQIETPQFYSRTVAFSLGERIRLFKSASTTVLGHFSFLTHEDPGQSATEPGLSLHQNFRLSERESLSLKASWDWSRARLAENDRTYYKAGAYFAVTELFWGTDASATLELTLTDTMNLSSTRGTEKTFAPAFVLTRPVFGKAQLQLSYAFTRNISLDHENYTYSRHVAGIGLNYRF